MSFTLSLDDGGGRTPRRLRWQAGLIRPVVRRSYTSGRPVKGTGMIHLEIRPPLKDTRPGAVYKSVDRKIKYVRTSIIYLSIYIDIDLDLFLEITGIVTGIIVDRYILFLCKKMFTTW